MIPIRVPVTIVDRCCAGAERERRPVDAQPVVLPRHGERLTEPPGPLQSSRWSVTPRRAAITLEPVRRLERADQHRAGNALLVADDVQAPVDPVRAVDVDVPAGEEHRRVALRAPVAEAMPGRILVVVGLDLDDHAADSVDEQLGADQLGRDRRAGYV